MLGVSVPVIWIVFVVFGNKPSKLLEIVGDSSADVGPRTGESGTREVRPNAIPPECESALADTALLAKENLTVAEVEVVVELVQRLFVFVVGECPAEESFGGK